MSDTSYCYQNTNVLKNKLNIHDFEKLQEAERKITMLRIFDLIDVPIEGNFDLKHFKEIHKYIFQDIYDWAGEFRTVDIAKGNMFCKVQFIHIQAEEIFKKINLQSLESINYDEFISKIAYYFSEINALHPFREGNGRTQREFIRELALKCGYKIDFSKISKEQMLEASKDSFLCKYDKMELLFKTCLSRCDFK